MHTSYLSVHVNTATRGVWKVVAFTAPHTSIIVVNYDSRPSKQELPKHQ